MKKDKWEELQQYSSWPQVRCFRPHVPGTPVRGLLLTPTLSWFSTLRPCQHGWVVDFTGLLLTDEVELVCADGHSEYFPVHMIMSWIERGTLKITKVGMDK